MDEACMEDEGPGSHRRDQPQQRPGGASEPLAPGAVIGILGGGQLGRMTALAAARFGYRCHIYTPEADAPAAQVSERTTIAAWNDAAALARFAAACDVATYEFENIPAAAARTVAAHVAMRPAPEVLITCQDRILEKRFLGRIGAPTPRWQAVATSAELADAVARIGLPAVLKSARLGYDGKGQVAIRDAHDLAGAWAEMVTADRDGDGNGNGNGNGEAAALAENEAGGAAGVLESFVDFVKEVSVVIARAADATSTAYVPVENQHENHVLRRTIAPARLPAAVAEQAVALATQIADALDLVGVMAVEMFVLADGSLLVNELAPRPHNSGHWTIDACAVSQFEQCVRAVAGLPLGPAERHADAVMENLLGDEVGRWRTVAAEADACLHIYGKREARPGRKMGHVTRLLPRR